VQRRCVVGKHSGAIYAELVNHLFRVQQPSKREQQFAASIGHVDWHKSKVDRVVAETLEFALDVCGQLHCRTYIRE